MIDPFPIPDDWRRYRTIDYGLDRLAMLICGASSIRDVIAFPKVQNASDPLTGAPYPVEQKQLDELHISFKDLEN